LAARILIVDDDEASRAFVRGILEQAGYESREATNGKEALEAAVEEHPLLVVLEVCLPGVCGYEVCRELRDKLGADVPIIFVSGARTEAFDRVAGLLIGADDYLVKPFAADELVARVRGLIRRATPPASGASKLTPREQEVLSLLAEGMGQDEIARHLYISKKTVGTHTEHIFAKLGVRNRAQAVAQAYRHHLVGNAA